MSKVRPALKIAAPVLLGLALLAGAAGCKAPIPGREGLEADAAWTAGEWRDDRGGVWQVRINSRRLSAVGKATVNDGAAIRGQIADGVLNFTLTNKEGAELGHGEARVVDGQDALYRLTGENGTPDDHGLWHFNHSPSGAIVAVAPSATASPGMETSPPSLVPTYGPATPTAAPTAQTSSPAADPVSPVPTPTSTRPGDPLDLRPPQ